MSQEAELVHRAVERAGKQGCAYAEARWQGTDDVVCFVRNGEAEPTQISSAAGIGVRVILDGALSFGASNLMTAESIDRLTDRVVRNARTASFAMREGKVRLSGERASSARWAVEEKKRAEDVSVESMVSFLKEIDSTLKNPIYGVSFPNRNLILGRSIEEKYYENSDGARLESRVPRFFYLGMLVGMYQGRPSSISVPPGYCGLGGTGGWEIMEALNLAESIPEGAARAVIGLKASVRPPAGETLDVILGPNVAGLTSHESCGHPGEADRILGREGAQAGESFLKPDRLGMDIGSKEAFVSDDPTIPHSMGFYLYDDEGVKARKRKLITEGRFTEFLQNRETASYFGIESNGSSRAVQFDREPIIRMGNTFIEPGDWTFEEMLKEIRRGVYIRSFMEWNIDDKRLNQRYVGLEAYLIENGKLGEPIREPIFEITTPKYWGSIDARANDLEYYCGTCGKGDPMQGAPVFFGSPHIRLRGVRVGAR